LAPAGAPASLRDLCNQHDQQILGLESFAFDTLMSTNLEKNLGTMGLLMIAAYGSAI